MDGNRRFARQCGISCSEGHSLGYDRMEKVLEWCLELGVEAVTVYAFSLDNFNRSHEEVRDCVFLDNLDDKVENLMQLAEQKFQRLVEKGQLLDKYGARISIIGDLAVLSPGVRKAMTRAMVASRHNSRCTLNICFAYTSRHEMKRAMELCQIGIARGDLLVSDVNPRLLSQCLYTAEQHDPDVIVRTSGEIRLSDFLLFQGGFALMHFVDVLWPAFSFGDVVSMVFAFQRQYSRLQRLRNAALQFDEDRQGWEDLWQTDVHRDPVCDAATNDQCPEAAEDLSSTGQWLRRAMWGCSASAVVLLYQEWWSRSLLALLGLFMILLVLPGTSVLALIKGLLRDWLSPSQLALGRPLWLVARHCSAWVRDALVRLWSTWLWRPSVPAATVAVAAGSLPDSTVTPTRVLSVGPVGEAREHRQRRFLQRVREEQWKYVEQEACLHDADWNGLLG